MPNPRKTAKAPHGAAQAAYAVTLHVFYAYGHEPAGVDPFDNRPAFAVEGSAGSVADALAMCFADCPAGRLARYRLTPHDGGPALIGWIGRDDPGGFMPGNPGDVRPFTGAAQ